MIKSSKKIIEVKKDFGTKKVMIDKNGIEYKVKNNAIGTD